MNIVERATEKVSGKEFYIPHKPIVRETAATTKMRVVYDASAHPTPDSVSLNECLNPGPPLQNKLWDVLVRQRAFPVAVNADLRRAFLQIRVKEADRDALRFHWRSSAEEEVETWRFTRVLFGLAPSPFLLNGVLEAHLDAWEERQPDVVAELRKSLYVDDVISGNQTVEQAQRTKQVATEIMSDATFELHKWNSNEPQLEDNDNRTSDSDEQSFAKQQLNVKPTESKMLGVKWDRHQDTLAVMIPTEQAKPTKRGILGKLASIYDPLGLIAPLTLTGKQIYRDVCEAKKPWDALLNNEHLKRWRRWELQLPREQQVPRPIVHYREKVQEVELHSFGDASISGVGAAVYAVVRQESGTTQRLVAAKGRLAKQNLTIPRLELVGAYMATNLLINVRNAYDNLPPPMLYGWLDSTVALHWIKGNGQYKQFVANRVAKIRLHKDIEWRYVPTDNNPADLASKGLRKRAKFLKSCKDALWARWYREYLAAMRERHNLATGARGHVSVGDVVIVKTDSRNRGKWPLAIVSDVYPGRDGNIRAVQLRTGKGMLERPIQHLYPLELYCDMVRPEAEQTLNPEARVFRPRRAAAVAAAERIKAIAEE